MAAEASSSTFSYDGPLPTKEARSGLLPATVERVYDSDFRVQSLKLNGAVVATQAFDPDSLLTQATSPLATQSFTRDPAHGLVTATSLSNIGTSQTYNSFGELKSFAATLKSDNSNLLSYQLGYDKLGRIVSKAETVYGASSTWGRSLKPAD